MALATLAALVHDILVTVGVYSLTGFEVTPATVIAILTILGFSIYDGIVVFDKVDENTRLVSSTTRMTYSDMVNLSLNQTLMRSLNTSITALLPIAVAAGRRLRLPRRHDAAGVRPGAAHRPRHRAPTRRSSSPARSSPCSRSASRGSATSAAASRRGRRRRARSSPRPSRTTSSCPPAWAPRRGAVAAVVGSDAGADRAPSHRRPRKKKR